MPIQVSGANSRTTRREEETPGELARNPVSNLAEALDPLMGRAAPNAAVTGRSQSRQAPPMPGGDPVSPGHHGFSLERLGLPGGADGGDTNALAALQAVRKALGIPESTPLTGKNVAEAAERSTPAILDALRGLGLDPGASLTDPKTQDAIKQVQGALGAEETGQLDIEQLLALLEANETNRSAQRATQRSSRSAGGAGQGAGTGGGGGMGTGGGGGMERLGQHNAPGEPQRNVWQKAQDFAHDKLGVGPGSAPTGSLRANQKEAYNAALQEGLSPTAAKALVANMTGESLAKPNDHHWDVSHMSQGIVQWDPSRAAAIKRQFGKEPRNMTVAEQTKAAVWEMKNKYPRTWNALQGSDPRAMMNALVRDYERPANPSGEIAKRMQHFNNLGHLG